MMYDLSSVISFHAKATDKGMQCTHKYAFICPGVTKPEGVVTDSCVQHDLGIQSWGSL